MKGICFNTGRTHFRKGHKPWNTGKKLPYIPHPGHKGKMVDNRHPLWKGNEVGYRALHYWVERRLGKPKCCDFCGSLNSKRYNWANKSGKYKREITDWIRLCTKCHLEFDKKRKEEVLN